MPDTRARRKRDRDLVETIMRKCGIDSAPRPRKLHRIGKWDPAKSESQARPLLVYFRSQQERDRILASSHIATQAMEGNLEIVPDSTTRDPNTREAPKWSPRAGNTSNGRLNLRVQCEIYKPISQPTEAVTAPATRSRARSADTIRAFNSPGLSSDRKNGPSPRAPSPRADIAPQPTQGDQKI